MKGISSVSLAVLTVAVTSTLTGLAQVPHFLAPVNYSAPGASMAVLADVNGDGFLDIVTANGYVLQGNGVSLLLGKGDGTFKPARAIVTGGNPSAVLVGDFNHDGKLDIAVANQPNPNAPLNPPTTGGPDPDSVSVLLGNGDGTFRAPVETLTSGALSLVAADFNLDGKLDLLVNTGDVTPVQILLGNGDGTFSVASAPAQAIGPLVSADFNLDGKPDFIADGFEFFGNGDGTFSAGPALPFGVQLVGDFNRDGLTDIAGIVGFGKPAQQAGEVSFGLGGGDFNQQPNVTVTTFTSQNNLILADFNLDGKLDIFGSGSGFPSPGNQILGGLFLGNGDGSFVNAQAGFGQNFDSANGIFFPAFAAAGDLDRNGSPDVIIANGTGVSVSLNTAGQPALLAQVTTNAHFIVGGSPKFTGSVSLGGPAPAAGAVVKLTSSSPAALLSAATATIPSGVQSKLFNVTTDPVTAPTLVTISASYRNVTQTTTFTVLPPFTIASVSPVTVIGMYGGASAIGTVTLTNPASDGTVVTLTSSDKTTLAVPASVAIPAGATSAHFAITAQHVAADTAITVTATLAGKSLAGTVTVKKETPTVTITKAEYVVKKGQLTINATSTDIGAPGQGKVPSLQVYNPATGVLLGNLVFNGANKGQGQFSAVLPVTGSLTSVSVQSFAGGLATATVAQK